MIRSYRIINRQNNMTAWGGGKSQGSALASPINDSIRLIPPLKFVVSDSIGSYISDSIYYGIVPIDRNFKVNDINGIAIIDSGGYENE